MTTTRTYRPGDPVSFVRPDDIARCLATGGQRRHDAPTESRPEARLGVLPTPSSSRFVGSISYGTVGRYVGEHPELYGWDWHLVAVDVVAVELLEGVEGIVDLGAELFVPIHASGIAPAEVTP